MKFDVFVSFRGADTRRTFVSHLWRALDQTGLKTFKHEEDILGNQPASSEVLQVIDECRVAVAIVSKNYASSVWCLDELVKMIDCEENGKLLIMPVFYEVEHSDVAKEAEDLGKDLTGERDNLEKVKQWRNALANLTRRSAHNSLYWKDDSNMIDNIVNNVYRHLLGTTPAPVDSNPRRPVNWSFLVSERTDEISTADVLTMMIEDGRDFFRAKGRLSGDEPISIIKPRLESSVSSETNNLIGMDRHMKAIITLLDLKSDDLVREIGICGTVGVGKTTLARLVYEQISPNFQHHFYFVNDTTRHRGGHDSTCLLENITREAIIGGSLGWYYEVEIKAKLRHQKVLLIVDGVDINSQLRGIYTIARWFGRGSRLVLVSESEDLLLHTVRDLYKLESMKYDEAIQLFSRCAFKQDYVPRGFDQLSTLAVFIAGHLPLAIKLLGSFLHGRDVNEWESELRKLEASGDEHRSMTTLSTYIGGDFYRRRSTNLDGCIGEEDEGDEFPSYCFSLV